MPKTSYKLKQLPSGPMEVWGTEMERPKQRDSFYQPLDEYRCKQLDDYAASWKLIASVKPEHEKGFRELANKNYTASTFIHDLSQGIIIPAELVGFEYETITTNLVGGTGTIKHAILIEPKEEGDLWTEAITEYIYQEQFLNKQDLIKHMEQKFTIKRR